MQRNIFFLLLILLVLAQRLPAQKNKVDGTYMRKWLILGPFFPQDLEHDFLADYGGETNIRPEAGDIVETKDGHQLTWTSYESPSFRVNFIAAVGRYDAATIYAFSYIEVDGDDDAENSGNVQGENLNNSEQNIEEKQAEHTEESADHEGMDDAPEAYKTFRDKKDKCIKVVMTP